MPKESPLLPGLEAERVHVKVLGASRHPKNPMFVDIRDMCVLYSSLRKRPNLSHYHHNLSVIFNPTWNISK